MLNWFYTIKVGSTYLTEDGLVTGSPIISTVRGLDVISDGLTTQEIIAIDGTPIQQDNHPVRGVPLTIEFPQEYRDMYFALKTIRLTARLAQTTVTVQLRDNGYGPGDFNLTTYFNSIRFPGEFKNERIENVTCNFTVATIGFPFEAEAGALVLAGQEATFA